MAHAARPGAYEALVTRRLEESLTHSGLSAERSDLSDAAAPDVLARHVAQAVQRALTSTKAQARAELVNRLLELVGAPEDEQVSQLEQLIALRLSAAGSSGPSWPRQRPVTPLSDVALLTNSRGEPNLGAELRAELDSADHVD